MEGALGWRGLGAQPGQGRLPGHGVPGHEARQAQVLRRVHGPEGVEVMGPPPLHPQRRVQHRAAGAGRERLESFRQEGLDAGMEDAVQPGPGGVVGEDMRRHPGAVQGAVRLEAAGSEGRCDDRQPFAAGPHGFPRECIGIDHGPATVGHQVCHETLPRGDAASEAEEGERRGQHGGSPLILPPTAPERHGA